MGGPTDRFGGKPCASPSIVFGAAQGKEVFPTYARSPHKRLARYDSRQGCERWLTLVVPLAVG